MEKERGKESETVKREREGGGEIEDAETCMHIHSLTRTHTTQRDKGRQRAEEVAWHTANGMAVLLILQSKHFK